MSLKKIFDRALSTKVNVSRLSTAKDEVGEYNESEAVVYSNVPAFIQPARSELEFMIQGKIHRQTHTCYVNRVFNGSNLNLRVGDIVFDQERTEKHLVISKDLFEIAKKNITSGHHIRLILERVTGTRFQE